MIISSKYLLNDGGGVLMKLFFSTLFANIFIPVLFF